MTEPEIDVGEPVVVGRHVIRPIASRRVSLLRGEKGHVVLGRLDAVGLMVEGPEGVQTIGLDGGELADASGPSSKQDGEPGGE